MKAPKQPQDALKGLSAGQLASWLASLQAVRKAAETQ
jgi:hypothetical protein